MVVDRQAGVENHVVKSMKCGSSKSKLLAFRSQRSRGGEGGYAKNQVVVGINVAIQREVFAGGIPDIVFKVEIGAMGALEREHFASAHSEGLKNSMLQGLVEMAVGVLLDWEAIAFQKCKILDEFRRFVEIHQHADSTALGWLEHSSEKPGEIEG